MRLFEVGVGHDTEHGGGGSPLHGGGGGGAGGVGVEW